MEYSLPTDIYDLLEWMETDEVGPYDPTPENIQHAREIAFEGWQQRAYERGMPAPVDLSDSCKFSSLFARALFGGVVAGNEDHQFVLIGGNLLDLNHDAQDVRAMLEQGIAAHRHDDIFMSDDDNLDVLLSCVPRVERWCNMFEKRLAAKMSEVRKPGMSR